MNCVYENKKNILIFTGGKSPSTEKILSTLKNFKIDINSSFMLKNLLLSMNLFCQ